MKESEVRKMLERAVGWREANVFLQNQFIREVEPLQYGRGPLLQAWAFYRAGYHCGIRVQTP